MAVATGIATLALALLVWHARELVMLVFAGILLATILAWPADALARRTRVPRWLALTGVVLALLAGAGLGGVFAGQRIAAQVQVLTQSVPGALGNTARQLEATTIGRFVLEQTTGARRTLEQQVRGAGFLAGVRGVISGTFGVLGNVVLVLLLTVFLAAAPDVYENGTVRLFPPRARPRVREILDTCRQTLRWWFLGQLGSMAIVGVLTFIGLALLGVPLAMTLALLAALLNFIPNFGPLIAATPAVLLALAPADGSSVLDVRAALLVAALYVVVQTIEGSFLTPLIQRRAIDMPPALIIGFQVLLALVVGPLGLVLATPFLAVTVVVIRMAYLEDALGDPPPDSAGAPEGAGSGAASDSEAGG